MGGKKSVLGDNARGQCQLGDTVGDDIQVGGLLRVGSEQLKKAGIIDTMIVIMTRVHIEGSFGHCAGANI